ncbi:MAG: hypothetical protein QGI86_25255 [Candidatus Poribacteria bacterium]|nr:hypothetical protein [Candidatus Poribacteria bacterium]MDP6751584.1 hypothetical protein [Candidatus Poribacteria bacterium]MDP6995774.1 hypothetical protein [Candidatus Poribacteria bacterium]
MECRCGADFYHHSIGLDQGVAVADPTPVLANLSQQKVSLKTVTVVAGQAVTVPIEVDNASGLLVADLKLSCDPLRLAYQQATPPT